MRHFKGYAQDQRIGSLVSLHRLAEDSTTKEEFLSKMSQMRGLTLKLIEIRTRKQSDNPLWYVYRRNVVTASIAHSIYHGQKKQSKKFRLFALIASVNHLPTGIPALIWGKENEGVALNAYQHMCQMTDSLHRICKFGLILDPNFCAWGGSPDAVGVRGDGSRYLIEVKCPYSFAQGSLKENGAEKLQYLTEGPSLKHSHQYYFQVQSLMGLMKLDTCILVVWCPNDFLVIEVPANPEFYNEIRTTCISYYTDIYLKHLFRP